MRQRSVSAIGVVVVGLVPALLGGIIFPIAFTIIALLAFREVLPLLKLERREFQIIGSACIVLAGILAWRYPDGRYLPLVMGISVLLPLAYIVFDRAGTPDRRDWTTAVGATLYLVLPTFAAIAIRGMDGTVDQSWFRTFSNAMPGNDRASEGLGWFLMALLITWMSDTAAYLIGKSIGRTKLIPRVSPNKTVEGALGGVIAAGITAVVCVVGFGLDMHPLTAVIFGIGIGIVGILGDLSESVLKRRAGVKDSSNLIPGHGGMLDRIDALIFILVAVWALLPVFQ